MDELTELEDDTVFRFNLEPFKSYEKDYDVQVDITIEMDLNLTVIAREGYTILDWISDIGGMQGMLLGLIAFLVAIWNYNQFQNYMVTRLYKMEKKDAREGKYENYDERSDFIFPCPGSNPRDCICDKLPGCFQCCRSGRRDKSIDLGRQKLE